MRRKSGKLGVKVEEVHGPDEIGGFIKALRREKGLAQETLAEELDVSRRTVSRRESGVSQRQRDYPKQSTLIFFLLYLVMLARQCQDCSISLVH